MTLDQLFPDEDYGFRLRFEQSPAAEFFAASEQREGILGERQRWLRDTPTKCMAVLPEAAPLLEETLSLAKEFSGEQELPPGGAHRLYGGDRAGPAMDALPQRDLPEQVLKLGECWEPDFLLLKAAAEGQIRLLAGCVCFPSSWSLEEKIGRPIEEIHEPVPGLNVAIGPQIHRFLSKLRPNTAWLRSNWGLSRSPELNQHPWRRLPRLDATVGADEIWLRVENQALVSLPGSGGILFGIRIANYPFTAMTSNPDLARRLSRALETMPEAVARYKGIAPARERLIELMRV